MKNLKKPHTEPTLSQEALEFVKKIRLGFVATLRSDGKPGLSDKGTLTVFDRRHLVFAELASAETIQNIKRSPEVVVEVVDHLSRKGYRFHGQGKLISFSIEGDKSLSMYDQGESGELPRRENNFVLIEIESSEEIFSPQYAWMSPLKDLRDRWKMNYHNLWKF